MFASARNAAFRTSRIAGLSARVGRSGWRRTRLLILCYHGISIRDEHEWDPQLYVSAATFERRLASIKAHGCVVLPLAEALKALSRGTLPDRAVVLTFDDGYFDFTLRAQPALQRYGFPATVYLTTQRCEHNFPIARLLTSYALWRQQDRVLDGSGLPGLDGRSYALASAELRRELVQKFSAAMIAIRPAEKDAIVADVVSRVGLDYQALRQERLVTLMNPEEVARAAAAGVDFQLHTHRHRTPTDTNVLVDEIVLNRKKIAAMTGRDPSHFCYPSGVWRRSYLPCLREQGIESATTCAVGLAERDSEPLLLPRVLDRDTATDEEFAAWLSGTAFWRPWRRTDQAAPDESMVAGGQATMS
jgi:peptidoglycan/xylan/chitin deacetylase (PgdA/CDA1 family)